MSIFIESFQEDFAEQNQWVAHEEAIEFCRIEHLDQAVYFLQRDLIFMRDVSRIESNLFLNIYQPTALLSYYTNTIKL